MSDDIIVRTPDILGGRPRINGHQVTVSNVINALETGFDPEEIATRVHTELTVDEVEAAVDWASKGQRLQAIRVEDLIAHEKTMRESRPPMSILVDSREFVSLETDDNNRTEFQPDGRFVRVFFDRKCDVYTVYGIDLNQDFATPIHDGAGVPFDLDDAINLATDFAIDHDLLIADEVYFARSAKLGEIYDSD